MFFFRQLWIKTGRTLNYEHFILGFGTMMDDEEKRRYIQSTIDNMRNKELKDQQAAKDKREYNRSLVVQLRDDLISFVPPFPESELVDVMSGKKFRQLRFHIDVNEHIEFVRFGLQQREWHCVQTNKWFSAQKYDLKISKEYFWKVHYHDSPPGHIEIRLASSNLFHVSSWQYELKEVPLWKSKAFASSKSDRTGDKPSEVLDVDKDILFSGILEVMALMIKEEESLNF